MVVKDGTFHHPAEVCPKFDIASFAREPKVAAPAADPR
jgi:hypothetical protein